MKDFEHQDDRAVARTLRPPSVRFSSRRSSPLPLVLILGATFGSQLPDEADCSSVPAFIGTPAVALLIAVPGTAFFYVLDLPPRCERPGPFHVLTGESLRSIERMLLFVVGLPQRVSSARSSRHGNDRLPWPHECTLQGCRWWSGLVVGSRLRMARAQRPSPSSPRWHCRRPAASEAATSARWLSP